MSRILRDKIRRLPLRLLIALGCYGVLVSVGLYFLLPVRSREDGYLLGMFLALFAILAWKSILHANKDK